MNLREQIQDGQDCANRLIEEIKRMIAIRQANMDVIELATFNDEIEKQLPKWINVGEKLPEPHIMVLILCYQNIIILGNYFIPEDKRRKPYWNDSGDGDNIPIEHVTHWMHIPKLPSK